MSIILDDLVVAVEDSEFVNVDEIQEPPAGTLYRGTFGRFTIEDLGGEIMFGRKQRTIYALRRRVLELEKRLCPDGHEWVNTGARVGAMVWYKCKKCGKDKLDFLWEAHST